MCTFQEGRLLVHWAGAGETEVAPLKSFLLPTPLHCGAESHPRLQVRLTLDPTRRVSKPPALRATNLRTSGLSTPMTDARVNEVRGGPKLLAKLGIGAPCTPARRVLRRLEKTPARGWGRGASSLWFGVGGALPKPAGTASPPF